MNRQFSFVSTCSSAGWEEYGERFVASFLENYPEDSQLYFYIDFKPSIRDPRVIYRHLDECRGLGKFQDDIQRLDFAQGKRVVDGEHDQSYNPQVVWNARKFSFKVFTVRDAVCRASEEVVTWVDADSIAFRPLPKRFIASLIPPYCMISYLGRASKYSECGYVSYNRQHWACQSFVDIVAALYSSGEIFAFKEWHDSYVFDLVRASFESELGVTNHNISYKVATSDHVFINSPLGQYLDHLKGGRKGEGRSRAGDLSVDRADIAYWVQKAEA